MAGVRNQIVAGALAFILCAGVATDARAERFEQTLQGRVSSIFDSSGTLVDDLAALGVTEGTPATVTIAVETTTPSEPDRDGESLSYPGGIVKLRFEAGNYVCSYDVLDNPELGPQSLLRVGNDIARAPSGLQDVYAGGTRGVDTDGLLDGSIRPLMQLVLTDISATAIDSEDIAQDLQPFLNLFQLAIVSGQAGSMTIRLDGGGSGGGGGGGGGATGDDTLCRPGFLSGASKLATSYFRCGARRTQRPPAKDATGAKEAKCFAKAEAKFAKAFDKVTAKALRKGTTCAHSGTPGSSIAATLGDRVEQMVIAARSGADLDDKNVRAYRGKILAIAATQAGKHLRALSKNARKPNAAKLEKSFTTLLSKAERAYEKALAKAQKKGVDVGGATPAALAQGVTDLVAGFVSILDDEG